jgi:hypothetical protein
MIVARAGFVALAGALVLAGCGKSDPAPRKQDVVTQAAKLPRPKPGQYTSLTQAHRLPR